MNDKKTFVEKLCDILVKQGSISQKESGNMKKDFGDRSKIAFDYFLISEGLVTKDKVLKALSEYYGVPSVDVVGYFFDHDLVIDFPKDFLLEHVIIPMEMDQEILTVVANQPDKPDLLEQIGRFTKYDIEFLVGNGQDILAAIREYYDESVTYIHDLTDEDESDEDVQDVDVDQIIDELVQDEEIKK